MLRCYRLVVSKELCYERLNEQLRRRHEQLWTSSATVLASLYHIARSKALLYRHHQQHAASTVVRWYRLVRLRREAEKCLAWLRIEQQAHELSAGLVRRRLAATWGQWKRHTESARARNETIAERIRHGDRRWITAHARRIHQLYEIAMAKRRLATERLTPQLDADVLRLLDVVLASQASRLTDKRAICTAFYDRLVADVSVWRAPEPHLRFLAKRYGLRLEALPVNKIRAWLTRRQQHVADSDGFLDLYAPLVVRTLEFVAEVSAYYTLQTRVASQRRLVLAQYEAKIVVRHYLALLYANHRVVFSPATTASAQLREQALVVLVRRDKEEWIKDPVATELGRESVSFRSEVPTRDAFTSFHCVMSDLCEKCLALQHPPQQSCLCCGHQRFERSTAAAPGHAVSSTVRRRAASERASSLSAALDDDNDHNDNLSDQLIDSQEACDFLVLNAVFHALAPLGHENRHAHASATLWKLAMAHATPCVAILYEQLQVQSLDRLLRVLHRMQTRGRDAEEAFERVVPPQVLEKLWLFGTLLFDELLSVNKELRKSSIGSS